MMSESPPPARPDAVDRGLAATFLGFAATSFLFDRAAALDWVGPDVGDPFGRALWWYGVNFDPLVAANPLHLQVTSALSAFAFGPFYLLLAWCLVRRRAWIRTPAIVYASVMLYSMVVHLVVEFYCETPPTNLAVFVGACAAYVGSSRVAAAHA
ncbi:MAG: DUF2781 domain-containing protein [Nannocystaceae bacterium]|nr:DUF2781 domain-containing protein [Nannocystaceae bacterium]